jgi:hypothetical protein
MPLERPQLLEARFPDRPIHKKSVYVSIMPVDAKTPHFINTPTLTLRPELAIEFQRFILRPYSSAGYCAIQEHR